MTRALGELWPEWREDGSAPIVMKASSKSMKFLTARLAFYPPQMNNKGNYIASLSKVRWWLAKQAEALGVEIYSGFAGAKLLHSDDGKAVQGVITNDISLDRSRKPKDPEWSSMLTGSCWPRAAMTPRPTRDGKDPQTYGLRIKEVWRVKDDVYEPGKVLHTLGWLLQRDTYGGSWIYHLEDNMIVDDILDYTSLEDELGKTGNGSDLKAGLITGLGLFAWKQFNWTFGELVVRKFCNPGNLDLAKEMVHKSDAIHSSYQLASHHIHLYLSQLNSFNDSKAKAGLE
ncbi:hypothetical protein PGT21_010396 [Puccinia graminis f. sp. tritici]|uniref:Electron transfer flavoprotein-ubiquinone oxidoreductase n=1 Tax=Puccinia graminis f. sp. tritici TaxID=56615 RepID=A0A5B0MBN6_PUCGR|nr:hypothetical protein PGT21_010396 [Puccinia graminis f. sp. tritici]KAA1122098.1 hypothetical protein PGTUg99_027200 [Puccinia graminis f. sp. tritici]